MPQPGPDLGPAPAPAPAPAPTPAPLWVRLLQQRREVGWGNFAWFSPKTLLLSINDQIIKVIEEPDESGSIVDRRRMRWVASQRARGVDPRRPVRVADSSGFLALGDPGEMDASQYVLVRDLVAKCRDLGDGGIRAAMLMSDVVYPAGNINQWADAVYLPYLGLPETSWQRAVEDEPVALRPPFEDWTVLAMPGNHDWYDGLNGFMYHACAAEALPEVTYNEQDFTWRQRIARRWWRNPDPPKRELLDQLRADLRTRAAGGIPTLPGPYYMVDFGCVGADAHPGLDPRKPHPKDCALFRLVVVDNGIANSIDVEQARWLTDHALQGSLPKILMTGSPLLVNNSIQVSRIAEVRPDPAAAHTARSRELGPHGVSNDPRSLLDLLSAAEAAGQKIVATLAGDIHNYQRITLPAAARRAGLPPLQLVAGGAGAFLSETHPIELRGDGSLTLTPKRSIRPSPAPAPITVPAEGYRHFPTRAASVRHFARASRAYTWSLLVLVVLSVGSLALMMSTAPSADLGVTVPLVRDDHGAVDVRTAVGATWVVVSSLMVAAGLAFRVTLSRPRGWFRRGVVAGCLLGAIGVLAVVGLTLGGASLAVAGAGAVLVGLLLVGQVIPPLVESFPELRRSWVARVIIAASLGLYLAKGSNRLLVLAAAAVGSVLFVLAKLLHRQWTKELTKRHLAGPDRTWARSLGVLAVRWLPFLATFAALVILTLWLPERVLRASGVPSAEADGYGALVRTLSSGTLALGAAVLVGAAVVPSLNRTRRTMTGGQNATIVAASAIATIAALLGVSASGVFGEPWPAAVPTLGFAGAAAVLGIGAGVVTLLRTALPRPLSAPDDAAILWALRRRDRLDPTPPASLGSRTELFAAMMVAGIPTVGSLAEATRPPFAKNVVAVRHLTDTDGAAVIEFEALALDDESPAPGSGTNPDAAQTAWPLGFHPIETCRVDIATRTVTVMPQQPAGPVDVVQPVEPTQTVDLTDHPDPAEL